MVEPYQTAGYQTVESLENPTNSLVYVAFILVMAGMMLPDIRLGVG